MALSIPLWLAAAWAASPAEKLLAAGRLAEGLAAAEAEARSQPDDVAAAELWIDALLAMGRPEAAVALARRRTELGPRDPDAWSLLGRATPDGQGAREAYEEALRLAPDHARAHAGMGAVHLAAGNAADARDAYATAVKRDDSLAEAWLGLVRAHRLLGSEVDAVAVLRKAAAAVPDNVSVALALADASPDGALGALRRTADRNAWDPRVHGVLARHLLAAGDFRGARSAAHAALAIDPSQPDALRALPPAEEVVAGRLDADGWSRLVAIRESGQSAGLDALIASWPMSGLARLARAEVRQAAGDLAGAEGDLSAARAARPDDAECAAALGLLRLAAGRPGDAVAPLDAARAARPWDASLWLMAGTARVRAGDPSGMALLAEARVRFPADRRLVTAEVDALLAAGRFEDAYAAARDGLRQSADPQLAAQFVAAAVRSGRGKEAAAFLEQIAEAGGSPGLASLAAKLRAGTAP